MIIPALLVHSEDEFTIKLEIIEGLSPLAQIDIMDGTFVPQTCWARPEVIKGLNTHQHFELHLMVNHPTEQLAAWREVAGVKRALAHIETLENPREFIEACRALDLECGLVLNPETAIQKVIPYFEYIDVVMFMGVHPGASGQDFIPTVLKQIEEVKKFQHRPLIEIDGGFDKDSLPHLKHAGVEAFAAGSAIFETEDPRAAFEELKQLVTK